MPFFRKKPVVIEARQWDGFDPKPIVEWVRGSAGPGVATYMWAGMAWSLSIETLEGRMEVTPEDYVIKGIRGEFYPCKPGIFQATYEQVES